MSSNIRIVKICGICNNEFIAKKTTTVSCSPNCAKRFYKLKKQNEKVSQAEIQNAIKKNPKAFLTEDQIKVINVKRYLTLKEAAVLLNIAPLTLRRWVLTGNMNSQKVGKKWIFDAKIIEKYILK